MGKWFVTWNRPEYKEWATEIPGGYGLVVLRQEMNRFMCVKAVLEMGETGLPAFKVRDEKYVKTDVVAKSQMEEWKKNF